MSITLGVKKVTRSDDTYTGAVSFTLSNAQELKDLFINIDALPTTSEVLTVTLNSGSGSSHILNSIDPSVATGTQWDLWMSENVSMTTGDTITVAYANTDANTINVVAHYLAS